MDSSLRERFGRLGPKKAVDQNLSGSRAVIALRPNLDLGRVHTIPAIRSLHRRGLSMIRAKRAIEATIEKGLTVVAVPKVEHLPSLAQELGDSGIIAMVIDVGEVDAKRIRERSGLTQEEFALRFGLDVDSLQSWESDRRAMPPAAQSYMRVIDRMPEQAGSALESAIDQS